MLAEKKEEIQDEEEESAGMSADFGNDGRSRRLRRCNRAFYKYFYPFDKNLFDNGLRDCRLLRIHSCSLISVCYDVNQC